MASNDTNNSLLNDIVVFSSWLIESENKGLHCALTLNTTNKSVDLEDVVQLNTCVHLLSNEEDLVEPCTIFIKIPDSTPELLSQLVVVSEARHIELYGRSDEYLSTFTSNYVDDFDDCAVYMTYCKFDPCKEISIKFQKTKHSNSMWLYGINLKINQCKPVVSSLTSINFQKVNEILKEAKIPLSENAERCKAFLQAYSGSLDHLKSPSKSTQPNPQVLMKMLEAEYLNNISETTKNVSKCFTNFVPFLSKTEPELKCDPVDKTNKLSNEVLFLKNYIDQRFREMESKIDKCEQKIKEAESKQNEKLDCIISLLNKLYSNK